MIKRIVNSNVFVAAILASSIGLSGCTTVESQSFRVSQNSAVQSAKIATNADFRKYDRLMAEEMGIFFPEDSPSTDEDVQRIRQIFRNAFIAELQDYRIVEEPGPSTMSVQASLIDLRNSARADLPGMRREIRDVAKPGSLVFLMEMKDSQSNAALARAADSAQAPTFAGTQGRETDWKSVEEAARHWAGLFRRFLDENLSP